MARLRCVTISECDDSIEDSGNPLLVCQVDEPTMRRVVALLVDMLAASAPPNPLPTRRGGTDETQP